MSDDILKELADLAVATKPSRNAKSPKTPVDIFIKSAKFQIEKATAVRDGKKQFEANGKSHAVGELRSDWFKHDGNGDRYWVQFGFNPVPVTDGDEPLVYMRADTIDKVIDILNKGVTLAESNPKFQVRIVATSEGAKRKKPDATPVGRKKRGPNKKKAAA